MSAILEQVFPSRIEATLLLRSESGEGDVDALKGAAHSIRKAADAFGRAPAAKLWFSLAEAIECVRFLEDWKRALLSGEADSDRLLRAAAARAKVMADSAGNTVFEQGLVEALSKIGEELTLDDVAPIRKRISEIPMPVAMCSDPEPTIPDWARSHHRDREPKKEDLAVAFLEFSINGQPAAEIQWLPSRQTHDLEISIKVSRWPDDAERLHLTPVSIEPESTFDLPTFVFDRPKGEAPFLFKQRGRMVLHAPQSLSAHPYEFIYAAEFSPLGSEQPVIVAGQRILRLDGADHSQNPITGYPAVDRKILDLREKLRLEPRIAESEVLASLPLLAAFGNLAGQSVQDARYPTQIDEATFQKDVRQFLRQHPNIGVDLEEQAYATGGRTDLSYRGVRIELKSEQRRNLRPDDCKKFAEQAASYAVGTNRLIAFLCVLDCSPKSTPPFPVEDGLLIIPVETKSAPVYVITFLIQGGIPKPSSFS